MLGVSNVVQKLWWLVILIVLALTDSTDDPTMNETDENQSG